MSVTHKVVLIPNAAISFNDTLSAVIEELGVYVRKNLKHIVDTNDNIYNAVQFAKLVDLDPALKEKFGVWKRPHAFSYDFKTFNINLGCGDKMERSIFCCPSNDNYNGINPENKEAYVFILSAHGKCDDVLNIVGQTCAKLGATYRLNNNNEIDGTFENKVIEEKA